MIKALGSVVAMPKSEVTGLIDTLKNTSAASILGEADFIHDMYPNVTKARADVEHICKLYNKGLKKADKIGMVAA
ncbi:hypothetical protein NQ034_06265 [Brevibacterium sp. 68QC2CO]|nr:hypothetical protein [Brevibacterium sp. 68QC2CO]